MKTKKTPIKYLIMAVFKEAEYGEKLTIPMIAEKSFGEQYGDHTSKNLEAKIKNNLPHAITAMKLLEDEPMFVYPERFETNKGKKYDRFQLTGNYIKCSEEQEHLILQYIDSLQFKSKAESNQLLEAKKFVSNNNLLKDTSKLQLEE